MPKQLWINLPVKDLNQAQEFYTKLGFSVDGQQGNGDYVKLTVGEHGIVVMLFPESTFQSFIKHKVSDAMQAGEVLFSIDAECREEVDEMARRAEMAGGEVFAVPGKNQGWMYGCGFADLDGHRWNVLYMDFSKVPKG